MIQNISSWFFFYRNIFKCVCVCFFWYLPIIWFYWQIVDCFWKWTMNYVICKLVNKISLDIFSVYVFYNPFSNLAMKYLSISQKKSYFVNSSFLYIVWTQNDFQQCHISFHNKFLTWCNKLTKLKVVQILFVSLLSAKINTWQ